MAVTSEKITLGECDKCEGHYALFPEKKLFAFVLPKSWPNYANFKDGLSKVAGDCSLEGAQLLTDRMLPTHRRNCDRLHKPPDSPEIALLKSRSHQRAWLERESLR